MSKRGWGILIGVLAVVAIGVMGVFAALNRSNDPTPAATTTHSPTPTPEASAPPAPSPSVTANPAPAPATCETTATDEFRAAMAQNGWISWETQDEQIGAKPFDRFPGGPPPGRLVCRWGESPDIATDNLIDLAWTPIDTDAAAAAQQVLAAEGYQRINANEGIYYAIPAQGGPGDAEGYGDTYLFTTDDVRWAMTKADVANVKAPDEAG